MFVDDVSTVPVRQRMAYMPFTPGSLLTRPYGQLEQTLIYVQTQLDRTFV